MKLERLISFFSKSPSAKLLRSPRAAHIVYFLEIHFKSSGSITNPHSLLLLRLAEFQETIHQSDPEVLRDRPETYLANWSTGDSRWLRRFHDVDHAESVYELTPHAEDVLKFLNDVLQRSLGFVGTESRLKRIIDALSDIVIRGSSDPARRLEHLRAEREEIDREILAIESGEAVATYSETAIRERFADAVSDLTSLQGDFRAVEESFKNITRDVQKRQNDTIGSRGDILGFALDEEDSLKSRDQGVSFDEFVRLVLSPSKQDELEALVARLGEIELLAEQVDGMQRIRGMMGSLSAEADKVLRTTRRLSSTLRRLLDTRANASRLRLAAVLGEIRVVATRLAEHPPGDRHGMEVYTLLDLLNVTQRSFWTAPTRFDATELTDHEPDEDDKIAAFRWLAELQRLDWLQMRHNISTMLAARERVPLPDLLEEYPPDSGAIGVLGYIQIAHDDEHEVDETKATMIHLPDILEDVSNPEEPSDMYQIPQVTFLSGRLRMLREGLRTGASGQ